MLPLFCFSLLFVSCRAFLAPTTITKRTGLRLSAQNDEVAALRAAAAKAREEADRLAMELGKKVDTSATTTSSKKQKLSKDELQVRLKTIFDSNDANNQIQELESLRQEGSLVLYKSANLRTYPVSLSMLESRTNLSLESFGFGNASGEKVSMDDFKYSTLFVLGGSAIAGVLSLALLPPNIGASLCYLFALVPILYLAIGSTAPAAIAQVIDGFKNKDVSDLVKEKDRIAYHEAAHFACGYMCGLPIADYTVSEGGVPCVEFSAGAQQRYTREQVAALSITALSGLVAESMEFGDVKGAENDLLELQQIFRKAEDFIGAQQQQDLTRWGALQAFLLLKENKAKLDKIVEAFKQEKDIAECAAILES